MHNAEIEMDHTSANAIKDTGKMENSALVSASDLLLSHK